MCLTAGNAGDSLSFVYPSTCNYPAVHLVAQLSRVSQLQSLVSQFSTNTVYLQAPKNARMMSKAIHQFQIILALCTCSFYVGILATV